MQISSCLLQCIGIGSFLGSFVVATPTTVTPGTTSHGDLMVVGTHNTSLVQKLYNQLDGTFKLDEDIFGSEARLHSIWLGQSAQSLKEMNFALANTTTGNLGSQGKRSDTMTVQSVACVTDTMINDGGYYLLTYAQEIWITSFMCTYMLDLTADFWGMVGLIATNVKCGPNLQTTCNVAFTILGAEAGVKIGPYMQEWCVTSYDQLFQYCTERGGSMEVLLTASGSQFDVTSFAVNTALTCPSGMACTTYTCNGQCNPGNLLPTKR